MRWMGEVVKRKMLKTVFFTALRNCSLRSVVLARLITTMARLMWWGEGRLTELGERRGAEMMPARCGTHGMEVLGGSWKIEVGEWGFWF